MNTWEILTTIREALLEFDSQPISNESLIRKLNLSYTFIYSHIVKSDDSRFGQKVNFPITATQTEYELPKEAWGKRIEQLVFPYPPTNNQNALGWHKIKRVDFKETYKYDIPRIRVWVPEVWSVLDNKLYIFPKTITNADAYIITTPLLVPLGITSGQVISTDTVNKTITLDTLNDTGLADRLTLPVNAFLSVVDYRTGDVKYVFNYSSVSTTTNTIQLVSPVRATYMGQTISDPADATIMADIDLDDIIVPGYATGISMFSTEYDQFLINQTVLLTRSSLNENDPETLNAMKENMQQLKSDLAGRPVGIHIQRDFGRGASYTRPGRVD